MMQTWEQSGYVFPIEVLSKQEVTRYRSLFDELEAKEGRDRSQTGLLDWHRRVRFIWDLATHPICLASIEQIIGPNILLLATQFFCKYPQPLAGDRFVDWHQDVTYWGLEPPLAITAWLAIDDSDVDNGCMRAICGSHRKGLVNHGKSDRDGNLLSINQAIAEDLVDEAAAVDVILKAGQMSLHHGHMIHSSRTNRSNRRRCGLVVRYIPTNVRQVKPHSLGQYYQPVLVHGVDLYQHFPPTRPPFHNKDAEGTRT